MQTVSTPANRNVAFHYPLAPVGARILAFLLDGVILAIYLIIVFSLRIGIGIEEWWIWMVLVIVPVFAFGLVFELLMNGQTPGKRITGIQVIKLDGTNPRAEHYLLRWASGIIDFIFLFGAVATIIIVAGGKGQRLGDIIAGTCVVRSSHTRSAKGPPAGEVYIPVFPEVIHLDDYYLELIHRAIGAHRDHDNSTPVQIVTQKIKSLLGIQSNMPSVQFLSTVVKDFNHLNTR